MGMKGVRMGTKTITMYVSDIDKSGIAEGEANHLSIRLPAGSTQQLDISAKNYRDLKLEGLGKTLKKRGRKPGSTSRTAAAARRRTRTRAHNKAQSAERPSSPAASANSGAGGALHEPARQAAHTPKTSAWWSVMVNPWRCAPRDAHRSTPQVSISTTRPQRRQTRWWWCTGLKRRKSDF